MNLNLQGKRVLVTGGASGLGYAIALGFVAEGAHVHICDADSTNFTSCEEQGISTSLCDVSDEASVMAMFENMKSLLGGLDILVNNVGIAGPTAAIEAIELEAWQQTLNINLAGHFLCSKYAVPMLKDAGGGSLIFISSTAGLFGYPLRSPYAASKWALIGLAKTLAMELGEFKIRSNAICPGSITNPRMDGVIERDAQARGLSVAEVRKNYEKQVSMQTFIEPEEIANMAVFIASDAGKHISGQALSVDGHTETLRS